MPNWGQFNWGQGYWGELSYAELKAAISRTPCSKMVMTLDYCGRTFGVSPCLATGEPCFNTYPTCKYISAYLKQSKDYKFTSANAPLPFQGPRPYIDSVKYMPTEIKDNKTVTSRVKINLHDEPDTDAGGIDPYLALRASVQGNFWQKLLARNPNYKGRQVKLSEGFLGIIETDFQQKFVGNIENIKLNKNGSVELELIDLLKSLSNVEIPAKVNVKLVINIDNSQTTITVDDASELDDPAAETKYVRIDDEIISYTTRNLTTNQISGGARAQFTTTAATHTANTKIAKILYYVPDNPYDILVQILTDAGIDAAYIDTGAFTGLKTYPISDIDRKAIITEPTKADKLYFELIDELDCKSWVNEDLKITIQKNIQNLPARTYTELTDIANIIYDSVSIDLNEVSRLTRISVYWNKLIFGSVDEKDSYNRLDIFLDADAEGVNEYNDEKEKVFYSRWLYENLTTEEIFEGYIKANFLRQLKRQRDAQALLTLSVELKDQDVRTGDFIKITTDKLQEIDGKPFTKRIFQIVRREPKENKIDLKTISMPKKHVSFFAPAGTPAYTSATEAQKEKYGFFTNARGKMSNDNAGYNFY